MSKTQGITKSHLEATLREIINQLHVMEDAAMRMKARALAEPENETDEHREERLRLHAFQQGKEWAYQDAREMVKSRLAPVMMEGEQ